MIKSKGNQTTQNLIMAAMNYALSALVGFFLTSYITNHISSEAYGFSNMATNFTQYIVIFTTALNYLSNRFISVSYHQNNIQESNRYFNTVLMGDSVIAAVVFAVSGFFILNLQNYIKIPVELVEDVKITFFFTFLQFGLSLAGTAFGSAAYVKNRVDLASVKSMVYTVCKIAFLIILFYLFQPHIFYIALSSCAAYSISLIIDIVLKRRLLPEISISMRFFSFKHFIEIIQSGFWNTVTQIGLIMNSGFDLLILNQMVGSYEMGILAISKTMPAAFDSGRNVVFSVFAPRQTILYAHKDKEGLIADILRTARIVAFMSMPMILSLILTSESFFRLWLPSKNDSEIEIITALFYILCAAFPASCVYVAITNVPIIYNRQKFTALQNIITNLLSLLVTLVLISRSGFGIYAVAGCSVVFTAISNLLVYLPYCVKKILEIPLISICRPMYIESFKLYTLFFVCIFLSRYVVASSWLMLIVQLVALILAVYLIMLFVVLNKTDRIALKKLILKRFMS